MRIFVISSGHSLDDDRVTRKQAVSLANLGYKVTVIARCRLNYQEPRIEMVDADSLKKIDQTKGTVCHETSRFERIARLRNLYKVVRKHSPDLVVAHEFETAVLASWMKKRFDIPFVFDAHECYEETMPLIFPKWLQGLAKWLLIRLLQRIVRNAAGVTAACPAALTYSYAKRAGVPARVLQNSPILKFFPFSEEESNVPVIVHEGNLTFERGALKILDALALVKREREFKFLVLGTIPDEVMKPFEEKMGELNLENIVDMRGRMPWTEFGVVEATGQIGLICSQPLPNHMLGLSNKLYNYMACGLAVIGMKNSATEKVIKDSKCGITVDTTKAKEIADGIIYLIDHKSERREMARNGRRAIENELGWHCMEKVMGEFYGKIEKGINSSKATFAATK